MWSGGGGRWCWGKGSGKEGWVGATKWVGPNGMSTKLLRDRAIGALWECDGGVMGNYTAGASWACR